MVKPGQYNELVMVKSTDFGIYLDGGDMGEILMPLKYVPPNTNAGDTVRCFVYYDSADRPIATTEVPKAVVGECAFLECVAVSEFGAFMDWGMIKDLFVPFREQKSAMVIGRSYVIYVYFDTNSSRIAGSVKIERFLDLTPSDFTEGQKVDLLIVRPTETGIVAVINGTHTGLLYKNEVFRTINPGDKTTGYIKQIRPDGKIDLALQLPGYDALLSENDKVLGVLKKYGGYIEVTDKSDPDEIYRLFEMSKKNWKKIIGTLYRNRKIIIEDNGIRLNEEGD